MDQQQLYKLYQEETSFHVNPPSFRTWLEDRQCKELYYERQKCISEHPPDEDAWNK